MVRVPQNMKHDTYIEAGKAAPALAGATYAGVTMNELVGIVTIAYVLLQAAFLVWKWRREVLNDRMKNEALEKIQE